MTVKAVQKGKIQFLSVPYDMPTAISGADGFNGHSASARYNVAGQQLGESQKGIIIGHQGVALKRVSTEARKSLEKFFGKTIYLEVFVKVDKDWRSSDRAMKAFGYNLD